MRYSKLHRPTRLAFGAVALLAMAVMPAAAQVANQSDVSGVSITSSSVVGPVFSMSLGGSARVITFITPQIAAVFQQSAGRINAQLSSQTFATSDGFRPSAATQNMLYEVLSEGTGSGPASTQLLSSLTGNNSSPQAVATAQAFVEAVRGLLAKGIVMNPEFFNSITATQFANAVAAYNAFVNSSGEAFLSAPPAEVTTMRSILLQLTPR